MKSKILIVVSLSSEKKNQLKISHTSGREDEDLFKKIKKGKNKIDSINKIKLFYVNKKVYVVIESSLKSNSFFSVGVGNTTDSALINAEKKLEEIMKVKNPKYRLIEKTV